MPRQNTRQIIQSLLADDIKGPVDNFKPSLWRIKITDDTEKPHGTNDVLLLSHKPLAIVDRGKQYNHF